MLGIYTKFLCLFYYRSNVHFCEQRTHSCAMRTFVCNAHFCEQCALLWAIRTFVSNAHFCAQCSFKPFSWFVMHYYITRNFTWKHIWLSCMILWHIQGIRSYLNLQEFTYEFHFFFCQDSAFTSSFLKFFNVPINLWTHSCCCFLFRQLLSFFFCFIHCFCSRHTYSYYIHIQSFISYLFWPSIGYGFILVVPFSWFSNSYWSASLAYISLI